jgi:DNA-directed RNA polymerase specialized sigma24 family protein
MVAHELGEADCGGRVAGGGAATASPDVCREAYREILRTARRFARSEDEARDLVQDALVIALARGFDDWSLPARQGWLRGVVRKRAAFVVRGQTRRRRREELPEGAPGSSAGGWTWREDFLASLPRSLRTVAALASADLCAAEIRWLLGLTDTALRQRLSALRRAVRAESEPPTLAASYPQPALGARRAHVLAGLRRQPGRVLATHDPDGHTILLRIGPHGIGLGGNG